MAVIHLHRIWDFGVRFKAERKAGAHRAGRGVGAGVLRPFDVRRIAAGTGPDLGAAQIRMGLDTFVDESVRKCRGRHGFCSFSGKQHLQLNGSVLHRRAQQYPGQLAGTLARLLTSERSSGYVLDGFAS